MQNSLQFGLPPHSTELAYPLTHTLLEQTYRQFTPIIIIILVMAPRSIFDEPEHPVLRPRAKEVLAAHGWELLTCSEFDTYDNCFGLTLTCKRNAALEDPFTDFPEDLALASCPCPVQIIPVVDAGTRRLKALALGNYQSTLEAVINSLGEVRF